MRWQQGATSAGELCDRADAAALKCAFSVTAQPLTMYRTKGHRDICRLPWVDRSLRLLSLIIYGAFRGYDATCVRVNFKPGGYRQLEHRSTPHASHLNAYRLLQYSQAAVQGFSEAVNVRQQLSSAVRHRQNAGPLIIRLTCNMTAVHGCSIPVSLSCR